MRKQESLVKLMVEVKKHLERLRLRWEDSRKIILWQWSLTSNRGKLQKTEIGGKIFI